MYAGLCVPLAMCLVTRTSFSFLAASVCLVLYIMITPSVLLSTLVTCNILGKVVGGPKSYSRRAISSTYAPTLQSFFVTFFV